MLCPLAFSMISLDETRLAQWQLGDFCQSAGKVLAELSREFETHSKMIREMKKDLDSIFKRVRAMKSTLYNKFPDAKKAALAAVPERVADPE